METPWENLSDAIFHHGRRHPDAPALIEGPETLSWGAFAERVGAAASWLRAQGLGEDDKVGLMLSGSADHLLLWFGLLRLGAMPVELPVGLAPGMLASLVEKLELRTLFHEATYTPPPPPLLAARLGLQWRAQLPTGVDARSERDADANRMMLLAPDDAGATIVTHRQQMTHPELHDQRWSPAHPGNFILTGALADAGIQSAMTRHILMGGAVILAPLHANRIELLRLIGGHDDVVCRVTPDLCRLFLQAAAGPGLLFPRMRLMFCEEGSLSAEEKQAMTMRVTPHFVEIPASGPGDDDSQGEEELVAEEMIRQNGIEFLSTEIEAVIATLPKIAEVSVASRPAPNGRGDESVAFVATTGRGSEFEIRVHCREHLPAAKQPTHIVFVPTLPRNAAGEIDRRSVKAAARRPLPQSS